MALDAPLRRSLRMEHTYLPDTTYRLLKICLACIFTERGVLNCEILEEIFIFVLLIFVCFSPFFFSLQLVLAILLPAMERLLEQFAPDTPMFLPDEALFLQLLLGKYTEASAPLLARDARSLELFITALGTSSKPYSHMDSFQIIAMEQVGSRTPPILLL